MCKWKGLPLKGNKADLIKKLDRHDASGSWREEIKRLGTDVDVGPVGSGELANSSWRDNEREDDRQAAQDDVRGEMDRSIPPIRLQEPLIGMEDSGGADITDQPRTERELLPSQWRREQELLRRELDITRRERDMAMQSSATSRVNNNLWSNFRQPISAISELVSEFAGERDAFDRWVRQFNLVRQTYSLDDNAARVLIGLKVKDQALKWFHSRPEHLETPIENLLEQMRNLFDVRPAKVELRRQFEKREWKSDETFGTYFYDKVILAGRVPVNEDELVDYLIDGIPDRFLQNQARMQRFVRKDMLLRAFENIKLRPENKGKHGRDSNVVASDKSKQGKPGVPQKNENKAEGTRCYNCNQTGHRMKECTKPKRDRGSCYECGVQGHGMRDCPQRQKKTTPTTEPEPKQSTPQVTSVTDQFVADNEYLKFVDFERIGGATNYHFRLDTQLDTASPISLIKEKFVPRDWIEKIACERYEGINGSTIQKDFDEF
ncbi:uncharacterized protein [Temnothorax nylanderi]|uniref:uncharacterized protein n=1 Tax=Temnothorax nylanderi TaxID=102681 RepID=UPI003A862315